MPLDYLRRISGRERTALANQQLGTVLAFVAGAANAGGFLAVQHYTSHMTGVISALADNIALGNVSIALGWLASLLCFMAGATLSSLLINWARDSQLNSEFVLPLVLEAILMLAFGLLGARIHEHITLYVSATVLLLCFMMGLQNAMITKISRAEIRTTHVTGLVTDISIELGRFLYWINRPVDEEVSADNKKNLCLHGALVLMFLLGGIIGALGFKNIGFTFSIPLAVLLVLLSIMPLLDDLRLQFKK
jgi:uncharacterized membrane protein YoaK (UPF0700 family)